ncbi:Polyol transporter 5 [Zea mays]|uniref:Polyol transporter 5 n=1 Tax=Zea mays TaxID=4577 RepID=A0A3L6EGA5_MAIZE|nr:Polyol transporter 5 [Zea mays]
MSAIVGMAFIPMYEAVGMAGTFYIFAAMSAAAWVFVYACLPETKGRSGPRGDGGTLRRRCRCCAVATGGVVVTFQTP